MKPLKFLNSLILDDNNEYKSFVDDDLDCMLTWKYKKQVFELYGDKEGPYNGITPIV